MRLKWLMVLILILGIAVLSIIDYHGRERRSPLNNPPPMRSSGGPDAIVKIVAFVDFRSLECGRGAEVLKEFISRHSLEDVALSVRYFPEVENNAIRSAVYVECMSRQNKFWEYQDLLFQKQFQWYDLPEPESVLKLLALEAGAGDQALEGCLADPKTRAVVLNEQAYGESLFIRSVPAYFVNGKMLEGVEPLSRELQTLHKKFFEEW